MWIKRTRYEELIRAEERAEMLRIRVNQLETEKAHEAFERTGVPQMVPVLATPNRPRPETPRTAARPSTPDEMIGAINFEDLGDVAARNEGYAVTD
jgi:hypothetical protein